MNCPLCGRATPDHLLERHHLKPHSDSKETAPVCVDCGNQVHELFTNNELRDSLNTIEALRAHPYIQKWIRWIRNKPFGVCMKAKKKR